MKRRTLFIFITALTFLLSIPFPLISKEKILFESFEKTGLWGIAGGENNAKQISLSILHATHSKHSLKIMFQNPTSTNKGIAVCEKPYDFSRVENLYIDIFNESKSKNYFSLNLYTGPKWKLHETKPYKLSPGWNKNIKIKAHKKIWQTNKKAKKYTRVLANPSDIRRIALVFYGPGGTAYIDNIRITGSIDKEPDHLPGELILFEDFERKSTWQKAVWEPLSTGVKKNSLFKSQGESSLQCDFENITLSQNAIFTKTFSDDWTYNKKVYLDIYNAAPVHLKFSLALCTGSAKTWHESFPYFLAPGWNKNIAVNLNSKNFKTESRKWEHKAHIKFKNDVNRISISLFGTAQNKISGSIYIDNIRLEKGEPLQTGRTPKEPVYLKKLDTEKYEYPEIRGIDMNSSEIGIYEKFELEIEIKSYYKNPFNPGEIQILAELKSPAGRIFRYPCFYYEKFSGDIEDEKLSKKGKGKWLLRFAPNELGTWKVHIIAKSHFGTVNSKKMKFKCIKSGNPGCIRTFGRYFSYASMKQYYPVGFNLYWISKQDSMTFADYFNSMSQNKCNWLRICNAVPQGNIIEWSKPGEAGIGWYNLQNLWKLDNILEQAESKGIYLQFVINHYEMFLEDGLWENNPYNYYEGGPCQRPIEFFTDREAKKFFKRKLSYIIARYGYSTAIMSWELFNKPDLIPGYNEEDVSAWHEEMLKFIKKTDKLNHLRTTSFARITAGDKIWRMPEIDYVQSHIYTDDIFHSIDYVNKYKSKYNKPHLIAEIGNVSIAEPRAEEKDKQGMGLLDALYSSILSPGSAGIAMYCGKDSIIGRYNLFLYYKNAISFLKNLRLDRIRLKPAEAKINTAEYSDFIFAPVMDWEDDITGEFKITRNGDLAAGGLISKFFHGRNHKDMRKSKTFRVNYPEDGSFSVFIDSVSKSGAKLVIKLDRKTVFSQAFPATPVGNRILNKTYEVQVKKGQHKINIENAGDDWIKVGKMKFKNTVPALRASGLINKHLGILWVKNRNFNIENSLQNIKPVKDAEIVIENYRNGVYYAALIDPITGKSRGQRRIIVRDRKLRIPLPGVRTYLSIHIMRIH